MDDIVSLVSQYRMLKSDRDEIYRIFKNDRDEIDAQMSTIKASLEPLVKANGNWQDASGYARITVTQPSEFLDVKAALSLMHSWLWSDDAIMQSCGRMLAGFVGEKKGSTYLSVK